LPFKCNLQRYTTVEEIRKLERTRLVLAEAELYTFNTVAPLAPSSARFQPSSASSEKLPP
jgi:hypothetical protein